MPWLKPIAMNVEKTMIRPVARRHEEDEEEYGAIDTWAVQKIGQKEKRYHKASQQK